MCKTKNAAPIQLHAVPPWYSFCQVKNNIIWQSMQTLKRTRKALMTQRPRTPMGRQYNCASTRMKEMTTPPYIKSTEVRSSLASASCTGSTSCFLETASRSTCTNLTHLEEQRLIVVNVCRDTTIEVV